MTCWLRSFTLSPVLVLMTLAPASAFKLQPISRVFESTGAGTTQSYEVINDKSEPIAVEVSVVERKINLEGQETHQPADSDFLIYPPQILLPPGGIQTIRVTWMGDPNPSKELAYRLIAEQLPIKTEQPNLLSQVEGSVKILIRYIGSLYVRPKGSRHKVVLDSMTRQKSSSGAEQLVITLQNQGTARALLGNLQLNLKANNKQITLGPKELQGMVDEVILAESIRRFIIPVPKGLPAGNVDATFSFTSTD